MNSTPAAASVRSNSPKRVAPALRCGVEFLAEPFEFLKRLDAFFHGPAKSRINQGQIDVTLVPLDDFVDGIHELPFNSAFHDTPSVAGSRQWQGASEQTTTGYRHLTSGIRSCDPPWAAA